MTVFYLKYRPKKIADLDLKAVREFLNKIVSTSERPQSFLFSGPKGSGKTSAARIFAKIINCESLDKGEACGKCSYCKQIDKGGVVDIMELDAASNRGIDEVRSLKEKIYSSPVSLKNKVFVIDEVHMMTKEAFNALLKILEEPPKNVNFILCTTNPEKIPETVLSRLLRVDFNKSTQEEMIDSLKKVVEGEKLKMESDTEFILGEIAKISEGSFRNGQKILMELVFLKGDKISKEDWLDFVDKKFGSEVYTAGGLEKDLIESNCKEVLQKIEKMAIAGVDMTNFRQKLIEYFQKKLIESFGNGNSVEMSVEKYNYFLKLLIQVGKDEKNAFLVQLPIQLAIVDFFEKFPKRDDGHKEIRKEEEKPVKLKIKAPVNTAQTSLDEVKNKWKDLLIAVKPYNHSVEAFLRAARPVELEMGRAVIEVFYKFHKERLEDPRNRKIVERGFEEILGTPLVYECRLASKGTLVDLVAENASSGELYDVAKEIFG